MRERPGCSHVPAQPWVRPLVFRRTRPRMQHSGNKGDQRYVGRHTAACARAPPQRRGDASFPQGQRSSDFPTSMRCLQTSHVHVACHSRVRCFRAEAACLSVQSRPARRGVESFHKGKKARERCAATSPGCPAPDLCGSKDTGGLAQICGRLL